MGVKRQRPAVVFGGMALAIAVVLSLTIWTFVGPHLPWRPAVLAWLLAINVTAFFFYGFDKSRVNDIGGRVPELVLHGLSAAGGSPGAFVGMQVFRHKTAKGTFRFIFWIIAGCQLLLLLYAGYRGWLWS